MPELRYTPFRRRLVDGFPLKTDDNVRALRVVRSDSLHLEDIGLMGEGKQRGKDEEKKYDTDPNNATNYPDDKVKPSSKNGKVAPEGIEQEEEILKTEEDDPAFIRKMGSEPYIRFADFCKYLSLFN